jgi:hypothetical protein
MQERLRARAQQRSAVDPHEAAVVRRRRGPQPQVRLHLIVLPVDLESGGEAELIGRPCADGVSAALDEDGVLPRGVTGTREPW